MQSFPLLEESLGTDGWRVVQKFYAGKGGAFQLHAFVPKLIPTWSTLASWLAVAGLTLDAQALRDLIQQYQVGCGQLAHPRQGFIF